MSLSKELDIAFSFDATGSMFNCLTEVRDKLKDIVQQLRKEIPGIRLAIFAQGDYDTQYQTKHIDFTTDSDELRRFVSGVEPAEIQDHFKDISECYELVLREVQEKLSWRADCQRALVMIGDWTPHEASYNLNRQSIDWKEEIKRLGVRIHAVQCNDHEDARPFYHTIAAQTFGHHYKLEDFKEVEKIILKICRREAGLEQELQKTGYLFGYRAEKNEDDIYWDDDKIDDVNQTMGLVCSSCRIGKLPNEYPPVTLSNECQHPPLSCLRCTVRSVESTTIKSIEPVKGKCPEIGCTQMVPLDCENMKWFKAILDTMFLDYSTVIENARQACRPEGDVINVTTMSGDSYWVKYESNMKITTLKEAIGKQFTPTLKVEQQKLLYENKSLSNRKRISDYNIQPNSTVHLILPLYSVGSRLDHVVFDLSWEYPEDSSQLDILDATCLAFNGKDFVQVIDWNHPKNNYYLSNSIEHTAENLTGENTGHQVIHVHLKRVPSSVSHLFFTLSSWKFPNLINFRNPRLQFYDYDNKDVNLCETTFDHALNCQAVIMCSVKRSSAGWDIFDYIDEGEEGLVKNGNAKRYNPVREKIVQIIESE